MKGRTRFSLYDYEIDESIEMLRAVRENAYIIEGARETIINDVSLDSFQFVIDNAIKIIEELRK